MFHPVTALIKNLETPGLEINLLFRKVRDDVLAATGRRRSRSSTARCRAKRSIPQAVMPGMRH